MAPGRERLHKFLARAGVASRRQSEQLIRQGRVKVDGQVITALGVCINPQTAVVKVDGRVVQVPQRTRTVLLHKPVGYVTTMADPQGRRQVTDLLGEQPERLFPVGRLDYDASGLLLLTNDGELAHRLMHPRYKVPKTYRVTVAGRFSDAARQQLLAGVELDGRPAQAIAVRILKTGANHSVLEMMLAHVGYPVRKLKRLAYGPLRLGRLAPGAWRDLTPQELAALRQAVQLDRDPSQTT
jgi:pseudouridine synthase